MDELSFLVDDSSVPMLSFSLFDDFPERLYVSSESWRIRVRRRLQLLSSSSNSNTLTWIQSRAFRSADKDGKMLVLLPRSLNGILLLDHSSFSWNARVSFEDGALKVYSTRRIPRNEEITINYVSDYHSFYIPTWRLFMNYGFFPDDVNSSSISVRFEWDEVSVRCVGLLNSSYSSNTCSDDGGLDVTIQGVMPSSMMELRLRTMMDETRRDRVLNGLYADRQSELRATKCLLNVLRGYDDRVTLAVEEEEEESVLSSAALKLMRMERDVIVKYRNVLEGVWKRVRRSGLL